MAGKRTLRIAMMGNVRSAHTQRWARAFAERGHDVHVLSIRSDTVPGVTVHPVFVGPANSRSAFFSFLSYLRLLVTARRRLGRLQPDIVHAHYTVTHGAIAAASGFRPIVLSAWGTDVLSPDKGAARFILRWLNRFALRKATTVTSTSSFMVPCIQQLAGREITVHQVPFGVDLEQFTPAERAADRNFRVGFVKHLKSKYGPGDLIAAAAILREEVPGLQIVMAGEGNLLDDLQAQAERLGIAEIVEFVGRVSHDEVPALMQTFDVLVNPSTSPESFGVVLLEASACRLPVVATDVGGVREVVQHEVTGLLVAAGRPEELAAALSRLAADPELRSKLGRAGRAYVDDRYRWDDTVNSMLEVVTSAAGSPA